MQGLLYGHAVGGKSDERRRMVIAFETRGYVGQHTEVFGDIERVLRDVLQKALTREGAIAQLGDERQFENFLISRESRFPGSLAPFFHIYYLEYRVYDVVSEINDTALHCPQVDVKEASVEGVGETGDMLYRLGRLQGAGDTGHEPDHRLGAAWRC